MDYESGSITLSLQVVQADKDDAGGQRRRLLGWRGLFGARIRVQLIVGGLGFRSQLQVLLVLGVGT